MVTLRSLAPQDRPAIEKLFRDYPFKTYQRKQQGLDSELLGGFFADRFLEKSLSGEGFHRVALREGQVIGAISLTPDRWHSDHYGIRMG
ncbi:MAG: hypothetical protein V2A74_07980, partial [bacterium]